VAVLSEDHAFPTVGEKPRRKPDPPGVPIAQVAEFWGCSERNVQELAKKGIAIRVAPGRYALSESTRRYLTHLRDLATNRQTVGGLDVVQEGAMLKREQRLLAEAKRQALEGRLIPMPDLEATWAPFVANVRQLYLALPSRAREKIPGFTVDMQTRLKEVCRAALKELSLTTMPLPAKDDVEEAE
jgi:phage terminase Nu1 subunit (DNA packaging protein)